MIFFIKNPNPTRKNSGGWEGSGGGGKARVSDVFSKESKSEKNLFFFFFFFFEGVKVRENWLV